MWLPLALIVGFALAFLALYLAERRYMEWEATELEADGRGERARGAGEEGGVEMPDS